MEGPKTPNKGDRANAFKRTDTNTDSVKLTAFVSNTMGRTRKRRVIKRKSKKGGARFRRKPRLVDKIAEGVAMGLSGPSPSFAKLGAFLAKQAQKGIKDNVQHHKRRKSFGNLLA